MPKKAKLAKEASKYQTSLARREITEEHALGEDGVSVLAFPPAVTVIIRYLCQGQYPIYYISALLIREMEKRALTFSDREASEMLSLVRRGQHELMAITEEEKRKDMWAWEQLHKANVIHHGRMPLDEERLLRNVLQYRSRARRKGRTEEQIAYDLWTIYHIRYNPEAPLRQQVIEQILYPKSSDPGQGPNPPRGYVYRGRGRPKGVKNKKKGGDEAA